MFKKILIANRGDNRSEAKVAAKAQAGEARVMLQPQLQQVAAKAQAGEARVMLQPHRLASAASGDRAAARACSRRS
ncbi:MAG: hypothetical protein JSW36_05070 [Burkholderiales bacterium]|nr:MAG: hypothetical protein JSW36_05070 [Burkholderiales bacterium]